MQLSIIIVNYNVKYFLEQCLYSLLEACKNIDAEIFVVDNNSSDGSKEFFKDRFPQVAFTWNDDNIGFGKANNLALAKAAAEYVLFLNPDTILPEDCLEKSIAFFRSKSVIGALGVKMIDGSGVYLKESKRGFPDPFTSMCKLTGLTALFPHSKFFAKYYLGHLPESKNHEVDVLAGAFMMISMEALDKSGPFDEKFFMYGEDVDLSYRIQQAGFKNYYFSETTIIHFKGESTKKGSLHYVRAFYGAMIVFVNKHYGNGVAIIYNILIKFAIWLKSIMAGAGHLVKWLMPKEKRIRYTAASIIAGEAQYEKICDILSGANWPGKIIDRISFTEGEPEVKGILVQLKEQLNQQKSGQVIFSNDELSIKEIIIAMQSLPAGLDYMFHLKKSSAIIGSNDKNSAGDYIAIKDPVG
ncbi:MAG: glycosyltransferase family 2 protein [Ferruginibacter sp.]